MANRRNVLIGLGGLVAAGGAALGTGAFTTVTAERTVSIETAGDASAFLTLEPASGDNGEFVDDNGDTIEINLDGSAAGNATTNNGTGLNLNAKTTFENLVRVTNNGTQQVTSLTLSLTDSNGDLDDETFKFTTSDSHVTSPVTNGGSIVDTLSTGSSVTFGLIVNLLTDDNSNVTDGDLPGSGPYTLTITADT